MSVERTSYDQIVVKDHDPTNTDLFPVGQQWLNVVTGEIFTCVERTVVSGNLYTKWIGNQGTVILPPAPGVDFFGDGSGIAFWRLDGDANDVGGVYNGVWTGTEQYTTGRDGQAALFNGSSRIDIAGLGSGLTVLTVSLWLNWGGTQFQMVVAFSNSYDVFIWNGAIGFNTFNADLYGVASLPQVGVWEHWCFEFHTGDYTLNKIWRNGVPQSLTQVTGSQNTANAVFNSPFSIGGSVAGYGLSGSVDHVRVFNRALTDAEVAQLANEI